MNKLEIKYVEFYKFVQENITFVENIKLKYLKLLEKLTKVEIISNEIFLQRLEQTKLFNGYIYVGYIGNIDNKENFNIVGTGTIYIEPKFFRGGSYTGHIEDIVVDSNYRGLGIAQNILERLKEYGKVNKCYKVILDCDKDLVGFYEKNDFQVLGVQMGKYYD